MTGEPAEQEWYQKILDAVTDGILISSGGYVVLVNKIFADMLGYEIDDLIDLPIDRLFDPMTIRNDPTIIERFIKNDAPSRFITRLRTKNGESIHVRFNPVSVRYEGQPAILASIDDMSKQLRLESTVAALEQRFASLYDMSPVAYFTISSAGVIEQVNQEGEKLLGLDASDIIGHHLSEFLFSAKTGDYDPAEQLLREVMRGKDVTGIEIQIRRSDGRTLWVSVSSAPLDYGTEHPAEIGLTAIDVTSRKAAETRLKEEMERADLYLSLMINDLNRTNQSALYSLEVISSAPSLSEEYRQLMMETAWGIRRASRMIANIRTLMTLRTTPPETRRTDIYPHIERGRREAARDFVRKSLVVRTDLREGMYFVRGHAFLWSAFFNVIHNCLMYDLNDEVVVDIRVTSKDGSVRIDIEDRGPGIPADMRERVFRRGVTLQDRGMQGGLGLTVVNTIISGLGGQVWIEDRIPGQSNQGTRVCIRLPAWIEAAEEAARETMIDFYKSEHCVFCGPMLDNLNFVLDELGVGRSQVRVIDVDDPASGVTVDQLPTLPTIRLGSTEVAGYLSAEDLRAVIMAAFVGVRRQSGVS